MSHSVASRIKAERLQHLEQRLSEVSTFDYDLTAVETTPPSGLSTGTASPPSDGSSGTPGVNLTPAALRRWPISVPGSATESEQSLVVPRSHSLGDAYVPYVVPSLTRARDDRD